MRRWTLSIGLIAATLGALAGCAGVDTRMAVEQLTHARVAVEAAETADAKSFAPDQLRHAQDALAIAKDAYNTQAFERSFDFAKKATLYARVAKARTEQKQQQQQAAALKEQVDRVQSKADSYLKSDLTPTTTPQPVMTITPTPPPAATPVPSLPTAGGAQ